MKLFSLSLILLYFVIPQFEVKSGEKDINSYSIDPGHTAVTIRVKRFGVVDVLGRFTEVSGSINYDTDDIANTSAEVVISVNSYSANNSGGEDAVMSPAFLDAANFPEITFKSKNAKTEGGKNYLIGDLTIHGTTNEVKLPFDLTGPMIDLPTQKQSVGIEASLEINRKDYGVAFDRTLPNGTEIVGSTVKIHLLILAIAK